jgi:hypothetical protein
MFRPTLRPSSVKSIQKPNKGRYNMNLILYGPCIILQSRVYVIQRDTQCFMIKFIHNTSMYWLNMFRTSTFQLQERFFFSKCMLRIWYVVFLIRKNTTYQMDPIYNPSSRVQTRPKTSDFSGRKKVKLWVPCRRFTAYKRSLNATWKSGIFRLNLPAISRPI